MKSLLNTFDLATMTSTNILTSEQHLEAPNWTPDGKTLIVNGSGQLYRVPLDGPKLHRIDTGFATKLNNDHGISPDGSRLVISDSSRTDGSCIYTLPIGGGAPERVTHNVPSYWHGWSPDGEILTYTARRGETFQIYCCPVGGGEEHQVTFDFDHCDGPDFTPDGRWIWFNGERQGSVQLWRVRPDGSMLEQMTHDEWVNWFPHPSPDGKYVVYLAYENQTRGHPANRPVELRLMAADGRDDEPKVLASFVGGQGTINVPSWAPDSHGFAYMHYEDVGTG